MRERKGGRRCHVRASPIVAAAGWSGLAALDGQVIAIRAERVQRGLQRERQSLRARSDS